MATLSCKMCGAALPVPDGATVATCEYCGREQTLPKLSDDKRANLYERANHFRRANEFDKATGIYEQILAEDNTDAEAYWSLVLCRYGIEYVEDPQTHKRIPTVNRAQYTSIFADEDYKSALENADLLQKKIYEAEAKSIDEIQKGILAISQKEEPFDVFICYKETDENGRRTPDSVLANDLYHQLTTEGFKVFFARITLEDKLGSAYEPYIFAALNSARVMVVLGTRPEYFNAVWVKNEWSRYLALIRQDHNRMLIPAYKDMDPYDLPEAFSHLQAQDMSKLGFMQDLIRGIKKLLGKKDAQAASGAAHPAQNASVSANEKLVQNGHQFLKLKDLNAAREKFQRVTKEYPEDYRGWWGLILCKTNNLTNGEAYSKEVRLWFSYVKQLADAAGYKTCEAKFSDYLSRVAVLRTEEDFDRVEGIVGNLQERLRENRLEISELKSSVSKTRTVLEDPEAIHLKYLEEAQKYEDFVHDERRTALRLFVAYIVGWLVALWLISLRIDSFFVAFLFPLAALVGGHWAAVIAVKNLWEAHKDKKRFKKEIADAENKFTADLKQFKTDIEAKERQIGELESANANLTSKVALCNQYLELGVETVRPYFHAQECAECGIEKSYNPIITEYRDLCMPICARLDPSNCTVLLDDAGKQEQRVIRALCEMQGITVDEAKEMIEDGVIAEDITRSEAEEIAEKLNECGAKTDILQSRTNI